MDNLIRTSYDKMNIRNLELQHWSKSALDSFPKHQFRYHGMKSESTQESWTLELAMKKNTRTSALIEIMSFWMLSKDSSGLRMEIKSIQASWFMDIKNEMDPIAEMQIYDTKQIKPAWSGNTNFVNNQSKPWN